MDKDEYKFPDEIDQGKTVDQINQDAEDEGKLDIEIEDDTPPEDRGRRPSEPEFVAQLENDELDEYSEAAKKKINEFKKVWNDERRAKEAALREQQEAINMAQRILEENKKLKSRLSAGDEALVSSYKETAEKEIQMAKKAYREAYDSGDTDALVDAQERMTDAKINLQRVNSFAPQEKALQEEENEVKIQQPQQKAPPDPKAMSWRENNTWFGQDEEMTSLAVMVGPIVTQLISRKSRAVPVRMPRRLTDRNSSDT
jgi:hypothetical protein